jgi:hypothetical protein
MLVVEVDKPMVKEGVLNPGQSMMFRLNPAVGQQLKTTLIGIPAGATMNIQTGVDILAKSTVNWQGIIPSSGEYQIEIVPLAGGASSNYRLEVSLTSPAATATPIPAPAAK